MKTTLKSEGYTYIRKLENGQHILKNKNGYELWFNNKNHASFGLIYKNTHLEFARNLNSKWVEHLP